MRNLTSSHRAVCFAWRLRHVSFATFLALALFDVGCAQPVAPAVPAPPAPAGILDLKSAAQQIAVDLAQQAGAGAESQSLVIDPLLDHATGQQTGVSRRMQDELGPALVASLHGVKVVPFDADGAAQSRFVITGTVTAGQSPTDYSVSVALTNRQNGLVVAQSAARFQEDGLDRAPTKFYSDSPSLTHDRSVDGYLRTAETPAGKPADELYVEQLPTAALLAQALDAYNNEHWEQALAAYTAAAGRQDGQQLRTFNGIYLCNTRLGRASAAEDAFGKIAALGLATNNLAVKLLFQPGSSTEFWPDLKSAYPMWLRQIARAAQAAGSCLNIIGHTSRSGSEAANDRLSLQRAETVKTLLEGDARPLTGKLRTTGVGFRENIVGTGADNASDAIDRRVEFKVVSCGG